MAEAGLRAQGDFGRSQAQWLEAGLGFGWVTCISMGCRGGSAIAVVTSTIAVVTSTIAVVTNGGAVVINRGVDIVGAIADSVKNGWNYPILDCGVEKLGRNWGFLPKAGGDRPGFEQYDSKTQALQALLTLVNTNVDELNQLKLDLAAAEKDLSSYAEKMLLAVGARYGRSSLQYEQAGGKRRKPRSPVKASPAPMPVSQAWAAEMPAVSSGLPVAR
jgi:hypothetical protein